MAASIAGKLELMHLVEKLKLQKRTGWVRENVDGAESIADHMYRMAVLSLLSEEDDELDIAKCVQMAVVHDLAEAEVGDITPFDGISREEKQAREAAAMHNITHKLLKPEGSASKRIHSLWHEYEAGETREARFVKDLDRIEMALQASEYESAQQSQRMQPFFESSIPKIQHPEVCSWADALMAERRQHHTDNSAYKHVQTQRATTNGHHPANTTPTQSRAPINFAPSGVHVTDPDEEIFHLYTALKAITLPEERTAGLGFVNSKSGLVTINIDVQQAAPCLACTASVATAQRAGCRSRKRNLKKATSPVRSVTHTVELQQDLTSLRHRAGDTGSVFWRVSIDLAQYIMTQLAILHTHKQCLSKQGFSAFNVLELGSGTGGLACLLAPFARSWTITDQEELLPLMKKNIARNEDRLREANIYVAELDWSWSDKQYARLFTQTLNGPERYDLILAVDCLFNENLVQSLVNVLRRQPAGVAIIASELRSEDVLRLFLDALLAVKDMQVERACSSAHSAGEEIPLLGPNYVVWLAWHSDTFANANEAVYIQN